MQELEGKYIAVGMVLIILCIAFVGYLNNLDIEDCVKRGHSKQHCLSIYNS